MANDIVIFKNGELELQVNVSPDLETVWLNRDQMSDLFDRDIKTIGKHISNIFKKIDVSDRTQAAVFAIKNNLIKLY